MTKGTNRFVAGLTLAVFVGATQTLPAIAQTEASTISSTQSAGITLVEQAYILGSGDVIRVDSFDTQELVLEPRYTVLPDGSINLPWVGGVSVSGLTLKQASEQLASKYSRYIRNPIITVSLLAPRPLKIGVIGEVNRPGSYIISVISNETTGASLNQRNTGGGGDGGGANQWPTIIKAIQTAGGITQSANVRQIQIKRPQPSGAEQLINVDLWSFLQTGALSQDISLRDGDTILVPKATKLDPAEVTQVAISNFSPETIRVNVVGEVVTPGTVQIRPSSTLNQGIMAAGGFKRGRAKNDVELIRLNPDGTVTRREIKVDLSQGLNEQNNPALYNNDIIVVNRNTIAGITDFIGTTVGPFLGLLGLFNIFQ
ncbi:polysaccharide biosynthesis/export family protein [Leptothermofonsia sp. ETS-13]|uniref:polysaccharide biosynthesis/export family protein n=1 Tax=Leptothermofonsia sp. ETS-13 TaxID=3035696 RepID=UPI003B9F065F